MVYQGYCILLATIAAAFMETIVDAAPFKGNPNNFTLDDLRFTPLQTRQMKTRMFYKFSTKWTNGIIPYTVEPAIQSDSVKMNAIKGAMAIYHAQTCIRFVERTNEQYYLNFMNGGPGRCYAYYGMSSAKQSLSIGDGCGTVGTVLHELMHSLGFVHEHQRPDRDDYVRIDTTKITPEYLYAFEKQSPQTVDLQDLRYDYRSTMHYFSTAFGINNQVTITTTKDPTMQNIIGMSDELSKCDLEKINKMYQCSQHLKNDASCLANVQVTCSDSAQCPSYIQTQPSACTDYPGYYFGICKMSCNNCNGNRCEDSSHSTVFNYYCADKQKSCSDYGKQMACPKTCGKC